MKCTSKKVKYIQRKIGVLFLALALLITSSMNFQVAEASSTSQAFNTSTGTLNVDYANYLSKHDIVFTSPITDPNYGMTVGNGRVGAMVWNTNGLTMQVSGVDTSEQTAFSAGMINLYSNPGMDTGYSTFQQKLSLYDGILTTKYDSNRTVTIMGSPNSEVMGIHVEDSRSGVSSVALDLSIWDLANLNNNGDVPDLNTWKTVSTFADPTVIGLSRGQTDANRFGYTLAASVEGAGFTTQTVSSGKVRLNITPSSSYTIWIACASRINAPNNDSVNQAKNLLNNVKATGYSTTLTNYKNWWHNFWNKSFVQYSNATGEADYMENFYYLSNYMIASGAYGNYPFHFINGVYRSTGDNTKWSNSYWYWNQRDVYYSFFASNHLDIMNTFNNLFVRNFNSLKSYTMTRYGIDGIWVPETMGWDGNARGTINSEYTQDIYSTGYEAAYNMYMQYKYSNDSAYLSSTAYPFMREAVKFLAGKFSYDSATGKYYMATSNSHETYWDVKNAITDLAAVRSLFPIAIEVSQSLNVDSGLRSQWQNILNNLVAYPTDGTNYLPHTPPIGERRNMENVACELIWPYDLTGIGASDYQMAVNTWNNRPCPYQNIWANDAIQAARLGLGDMAYQGMKRMLLQYQNYPNGLTANTNGVFEFHGVHLTALNESLMQSYNDKIRVFPALPNDSSFVSKFTLLAKGGFLVSSERENSEVKYVGIKSLYGNTAKVVNPWGTQQVQVRRASDNSIVTTSSGSEITFATTANTVYIVERTAKTLSAYTYEQLTGTANNNGKSMPGTSLALGSVAPEAGKYEAENGTLAGGAQKGSDFAASGGMEVTNMSTGASITFSNVIAGNQMDIGYCTRNNPGQLSFYINGVHNQDVVFPNTNSWDGYYAIKSININVPQGATVKIQCDSGDSGANIDYIKITGQGGATPTPTPTSAPTPTPTATTATVTLPGIVEAENYSAMFGIQTEGCSEGTLDVGWTDAGDWMDYNVNVTTAGTYTVTARVASPNTNTAFKIQKGGTDLGTITVPNTGAWQTYTNASTNITLSAGVQTLRVYITAGGFNINKLTFTTGTAATPTPTPSSTPNGLPDLIVTDVQWTPTTPVTGNEVIFKAVVKNQGTGVSSAGVINGVAFQVNGTLVNWSDTNITPIQPGASVTLTANFGPSNKDSWTAVSGTHTVNAWVDDVNRISESNEGNNQFSKSITISSVGATPTPTPSPTPTATPTPTPSPTPTATPTPTPSPTPTITPTPTPTPTPNSPDMIVTDITYSPAAPAAGNAVTFSAVVKNQGTAAGTAGVVVFRVNGTQVAASANSTTSIAAGASLTVAGSGTWTAASGTHTLNAVVDNNNTTTESNETNNSYSENLTVGGTGAPDLVVTDISWSPASPAVGNAVTFSIVVRNQGTGATPAGVVHGVGISIDGGATSLWSDNYTSSIPAGASVTLTVNGGSSGPTWNAVSGTHSVRAFVDDVNRIPNESNETNNQYTENIAVGSGGGNLAQGKSITASSTTQSYVATNANDGNVNTYWEGAANTYPNNLSVDLGSAETVSRVVVKLNPSWGTRTQTLSVLTSTDNTSYTTRAASATYTFNAGTNTVTINFTGVSARYVRLSFTANSGATAAQAAEFEVY